MKRLLIYSQDGTGLGHLQRTRNIAREILLLEPETSILILADSSLTPFFAPIPGLDYLKLPTILKTGDVSWKTSTLPLNISDMVNLRAKIIQKTFCAFNPDAVLVDHMPVGALGELKPLLEYSQRKGKKAKLFLGLRDILDRPELIRQVWKDMNAYRYLPFYDGIFIYGTNNIYPVEDAYGLTPMAENLTYCNYVTQPMDSNGSTHSSPDPSTDPFIFVMAGGGRDAFHMTNTFMDAFPILHRKTEVGAYILTGPQMPQADRDMLKRKAEGYPIQMFSSSDEVARYLQKASAVVTMAGYNSLCEVLAWGKKSLVVPRSGPSSEQRIRTRLFAERDLVRMLDPDELSPDRMAEDIKNLLVDTGLPNKANMPPLNGAKRAAALLLEINGGAHYPKSPIQENRQGRQDE